MAAQNNIEQLLSIMAQLRDKESGCLWDRKQTFDSIIPHTIEETYEVVDAIHKKDWENLKEELGDLLFQVVFYAQMAKEDGLFDFSDVVDTLNEKLVRRHSHVFSDEVFSSEEEIIANWDKVKQQERLEKEALNNISQEQGSILDSVPTALPGLLRANKIQKQCAKVGFDWDELQPVADKVNEEVAEVLEEALKKPRNEAKLEEELGDLFFAAVNFSRHLGKNPEQALCKANDKFERRFRQIEANVAKKNKKIEQCDLNELDSEWEKVKQSERN
ncbi:nucleoside triphosphate pyrophosphohydrolase [Aliivibrio finisterrensis]|uniref:nucleoside triphosphate pyrophosphohydrolase n=1 Tax=Aliivibrio finisterrensis TaxID=511998 RepID=UPI00101EBDFD|nr:nucleoside triphosphate pyrophosphohydrolase [Aliivibrio finisterrensis]RYU68042.1 nucleoside triphosphate pyrophosphohydrolase [Aliivibrio finisterrensis]RYU71710.1 nucleoside triphosphate pyrophosphohydrolase [Aliivibrio finisterrensis]RYU75385.1 nucleoside triphosphate pyrophosphohydrolase [Aliivibrio finisterrensis]